ncbi:site-specific integrase [Photobacterium sanguinicancri]|uniref:site-specific integrase n=1 Tax=Photobacterium sanguinicancri TaxID=875932 RepID=UPI001EFC46C3|nr:site-specific integrase [Photobacterium sanguinicancri]
MWQGFLVSQRDSSKNVKPSDDTIFNDASLVFSFYSWAKRKEFPVLINTTSVSWKYNYRENSKLRSNKNMLSGSYPETGNIDIGKKSNRNWTKFKRSQIIIMSNDNISSLMSSYSDIVYPAMFMHALSTGLRAVGVCQTPYIGYGENNHIRTYPEILNTLKPVGSNEIKTFDFRVVEKGSKARIVKVNLSAWKSVCELYYPYYAERRAKYKKKYPNGNPDHHFFLAKNGNPVTPSMISSATNYAKGKLNKFKWSFRNSRDWYATNFIIQSLTKEQITNGYYNIAVDEALQAQLGHNDYKTTYYFYIRVASIILALESGHLDYTLGKSQDFWTDINNEVIHGR